MNKQVNLFLIASLLGILLLLFLSQTLQPLQTNLVNITSKNLNQRVQVNALIVQVINLNNNTFQLLTLKDSTGSIIATSSSAALLNINSSKIYKIIGKVTEYNQTLQISAETIRLLT